MAQTEEARDSGKHSRTESTSSNNSTNMPSQQQLHSPGKTLINLSFNSLKQILFELRINSLMLN